jgi:hypothetical protein
MRRVPPMPRGVRGQQQRTGAQQDNGRSHEPPLPGNAAAVRPVVSRSLREP